MNILLTNDDGVHSPGIAALASVLAAEHRVWIVAPSSERSAVGHAITMHMPLFAKQKVLPGLEHVPTWSVSGTPADTVKLGLRALIEEKIDLVIAGINIGANMGSDIFYSGTISAAMEAAFMGYRGIAVSLEMKSADSLLHMSGAAKCVQAFLAQTNVDRDVSRVININVPALPFEEIRGFRCGRQGAMQFDDWYEKRTDPRGREYYWLTGKLVGGDAPDTDAGIVAAGYVALTPLHADLTDRAQMEQLKCNFENMKLHL